ncbi:hypothetical protein ACFO25_16480 [Paenactinomyces guangxiensis]|uniref:Uncharacterized protein n=1 Tax=Paenactinomyces guangxiensis TaxID=1490290 RepID=A0A7W1WU27_9BACL|nr:hypothetical protein [Paenactinomyces guangxiensis]MBA4496088.1 hypothetical protein [Paenactinomyces guangxiensis]MBH8593176.1 hypothetical protein [Paenactinomyces guangxiensis]
MSRDDKSVTGGQLDAFEEENARWHAWWKEEKEIKPLSNYLQILLEKEDPQFPEKFARRRGTDPSWLWTLYMHGTPLAHRALFKTLEQNVYFTKEQYRYVKGIYKLAELRSDYKTWAKLTWLFDTSRWNSREYYTGHLKLYSMATANYLRRRSWRKLRQLGKAGSADYVRLATEILLNYDPEDWSWWIKTRDDELTGYIHFFVFNQILYRNSKRFLCHENRKWKLADLPEEDLTRFPEEREEAFPELWDDCPEELLRLIQKGKAKPVIQFAIRALKAGNMDYLNSLEYRVFIDLLESGHPVKRQFATEQLLLRIDPNQPDFSLWMKLAVNDDPEVQRSAIRFVEMHVAKWSWVKSMELTEMILQALCKNPVPESAVCSLTELLEGALGSFFHQAASLEKAKQLLASLNSEKVQILGARMLLHLYIDLKPYTELDLGPFLTSSVYEVRKVAQSLLVKHYKRWSIDETFVLALVEYRDNIELFLEEPLLSVLKEMNAIQIAGQLLQSREPETRRLAARVLDKIRPDYYTPLQFTAKQLIPFLLSGEIQVRQSAREILKYDIYYFHEQINADFLMEWLLIDDEDHQRYVLDCFSYWRLRWYWNQQINNTWTQIFPQLWARMTQSDTPEGVRNFIREELMGRLFWDKIDPGLDRVLLLINSRDAGLQELGARLLQRWEPGSKEVGVEELSSLAHCRIAFARREARGWLDRVKQQLKAEEWVNLVETDWEDTRGWVFEQIENAAEEMVSPTLIYGLLDSSIDEVRQKAMELAEQYEEQLDARELVLRASESPYLSVLTFAVERAQQLRWSAEHLGELELFFRQILFRVNQGRKAKNLAFRLLAQWGEENKELAQVAVRVLSDYARNGGKRDFEQVLVILTKLRSLYPELELPVLLVK